MSSSSESEGNEDSELPTLSIVSGQDEPQKKRKKKDQAFVDSWLTSSEFENWLTKKVGANNQVTAFCKICDKTVTCSKTGLKRHMGSNKHQENSRAAEQIPTISGMFSKATTRDETSTMEIKLCSFIAEHNLPLSISDAFVSLLRSLFPRDNVLRNAKLGKQRATNVVRQVIGIDYLNEAVTTFRSRKFSFIIDETTDKSTAKQLAILTMHFDIASLHFKQYLLDMIEVDDGFD